MDIVVWLRSLGLGKYEAAFRENEIDETVLPGLTAEDLKELGVMALGHRRQAARRHRCFAWRCGRQGALRRRSAHIERPKRISRRPRRSAVRCP